MRSTKLIASIAAFACLVPLAARGDAVPTFGTPARANISGTEPGIDIGDDGTVFVNAPAGLGFHSLLARSTNGGATFTPLSFSNPWWRLPGGGDSDVALAPGGRVYFLDLWVGSNSLTVSRDNGSTWTSGTPFTTLPLTDRQWIAVGDRDEKGDDTLYIAYQIIQPPGSLSFSRSRDSGLTWTQHALPSGTQDSIPGQVVAAGDFVAISFIPVNPINPTNDPALQNPNARQLWVALSHDAGSTWTTVRADTEADVATQIFSGAGLALDGNDLYATYVDRDDNTITLLRSPDRGATWAPPVTVSSPDHTAVFPWVAARAGKAAIAWYGADVSGDPNELTAANWRVMYTESFDGGATLTTPVAATGIVKTGVVCTRGLSCAGGRELGDFMQLAIDANGKSLLAYTRGPVYVVRQQ